MISFYSAKGDDEKDGETVESTYLSEVIISDILSCVVVLCLLTQLSLVAALGQVIMLLLVITHTSQLEPLNRCSRCVSYAGICGNALRKD